MHISVQKKYNSPLFSGPHQNQYHYDFLSNKDNQLVKINLSLLMILVVRKKPNVMSKCSQTYVPDVSLSNNPRKIQFHILKW